MDILRERYLELPTEERLAKLAVEDWIANMSQALVGELSFQIQQDGLGDELFDKETFGAMLTDAGLDPTQGLSAMDALNFETWYADPGRTTQLEQLGIPNLSKVMQENHPVTQQIRQISETTIYEIKELLRIHAFLMKKNEVYHTLKGIFRVHKQELENLYKKSTPEEASLGSTAKR